MKKDDMPAIQNLDKTPMLSNQHTISHQAERFVIDFKGIFPQFTPDNKPQMVISHKAVMLDPYVAKELLNTLKTNIKKFEDKYGAIKTPKAVEKARKEIKKKKKSDKDATTAPQRPSYMG